MFFGGPRFNSSAGNNAAGFGDAVECCLDWCIRRWGVTRACDGTYAFRHPVSFQGSAPKVSVQILITERSVIVSIPQMLLLKQQQVS